MRIYYFLFLFVLFSTSCVNKSCEPPPSEWLELYVVDSLGNNYFKTISEAESNVEVLYSEGVNFWIDSTEYRDVRLNIYSKKDVYLKADTFSIDTIFMLHNLNLGSCGDYTNIERCFINNKKKNIEQTSLGSSGYLLVK